MKSQRSASKLHPLVDLSKRGPKQLIQIFMHFLQHTAAMLVLRLLKKEGQDTVPFSVKLKMLEV